MEPLTAWCACLHIPGMHKYRDMHLMARRTVLVASVVYVTELRVSDCVSSNYRIIANNELDSTWKDEIIAKCR
jgi:hypothetical protein